MTNKTYPQLLKIFERNHLSNSCKLFEAPPPDFKIMGIVNVTPDSFSDGGRYLHPHLAYQRVLEMFEQGADIVDLGAESTRPGAVEISEDEEWNRLFPVLKLLKSQGSVLDKISIDTKKEKIMEKAACFGVAYINHVCTKPLSIEIIDILVKRSVKYIAMHIVNQPATMQIKPLSASDSLTSVSNFYKNYKDYLLQMGFIEKDIFFDPGIGFGKSDQANWLLLHTVKHFSQHYSLAIGVSRKSFLGRCLDLKNPMDRDDPSKILELMLSFFGAKIIRTHEVKKLANLRQITKDFHL